jgi:hypothetical protein
MTVQLVDHAGAARPAEIIASGPSPGDHRLALRVEKKSPSSLTSRDTTERDDGMLLILHLVPLVASSWSNRPLALALRRPGLIAVVQRRVGPSSSTVTSIAYSGCRHRSRSGECYIPDVPERLVACTQSRV